ncbi:hypothetical protein DL95DRAFT_445690 [Leptodontidium sp. 2 PMI_412]|nr:hypothetical protein DL95DRAFT_445690 [Leptodontidium sp. 2 PMI_412]
MISWHRFPQEIRLTIFEFLLQDGCSLAAFATVSQEWQTIIERYTFSRIKLTSSRVPYFASIVHRNRHLVRYIWLCLELQEYNCTRCEPQDPELWGLSHEDNVLIATALQDLFSALSVWEPADSSLLLDISVYSPSDSEHCFKYLTFEPDDASDMRWQNQSAKQSMLVNVTDHDHGWVDGIRNSIPAYLAIDKLFGEIMGEGPFDDEEEEGEWWQQLPLVPAITGVLLRQQTRRRWKPAALAHMFSRLPGLQEIHYEPWREWLGGQQPWSDRCCDPVRIPSFHVSRAVANASLTLEHLSASFIVEASQFFAARELYWTWPNLTWLALTSNLLVPQELQTELDDMLQSAAAAAMKMPNLETMELWNGEKGLAMLFKYQRAEPGQSAAITCRGTWELTLQPLVIQGWDAVALRHRGRGCIIVKELLDAGVRVKSHDDAISHLKLSRPVIRPVSLRQIQMEHLIREGVQP